MKTQHLRLISSSKNNAESVDRSLTDVGSSVRSVRPSTAAALARLKSAIIILWRVIGLPFLFVRAVFRFFVRLGIGVLHTVASLIMAAFGFTAGLFLLCIFGLVMAHFAGV